MTEKKILEKTVIRCDFKEKVNSLFQWCDYIPFIQKDMKTIIFFDKKKNRKSI